MPCRWALIDQVAWETLIPISSGRCLCSTSWKGGKFIPSLRFYVSPTPWIYVDACHLFPRDSTFTHGSSASIWVELFPARMELWGSKTIQLSTQDRWWTERSPMLSGWCLLQTTSPTTHAASCICQTLSLGPCPVAGSNNQASVLPMHFWSQYYLPFHTTLDVLLFSEINVSVPIRRVSKV